MDKLREEITDKLQILIRRSNVTKKLLAQCVNAIMLIIEQAGYVHLDSWLDQPDPQGRVVQICTSEQATPCDYHNDSGLCDSVTCEDRGSRVATRGEILEGV